MSKPIVLDHYDLTPIVNFIQTRYALAFTEHNANQLKQAIKSRCQAFGLETPIGYLDILNQQPEEERLFINAITTGETCFYRYPQMTQLFLNQFSKRVAERTLAQMAPSQTPKKSPQHTALQNHQSTHAFPTDVSPPLRILHIGCSTGEEPYTTAILLHQQGYLNKTQVQINAIDLNALSIQHAMARQYSSKALRNTPPLIKKRYFQERPNQLFELTPEIANLVNFHSMNVFTLTTSPLMQKYDFIFCMNVMIYFDQPTITRLTRVLKQLMTEDSRLYLAPTDSIMQMNEHFQVQRTPNGFWYGLPSETNTTRNTQRPRPVTDGQKCQCQTVQFPSSVTANSSLLGKNTTPPSETDTGFSVQSTSEQSTSKQRISEQPPLVRHTTNDKSTDLYALAIQAYEHKALDEAEDCFQQSIQQAHKVTECQLGLAKIYADRGHAIQAAELAESVLMKTQNDEAYLLLGILNLQAGNHPEAKALFHRSLSLNANNTEAKHFLSFLDTSPEAP